MELGQWLHHLAQENNGAQAIEALGDLVLYARIEAMGRLHDETPGDYVAAAAGRFAALAADEDWLALMTGLEKSDAPTRTALKIMLEWALAQDQLAQDQLAQDQRNQDRAGFNLSNIHAPRPGRENKCTCGSNKETCHDPHA